MTHTTKVSRLTPRSAFWLWAVFCLLGALMGILTLTPYVLVFFGGALVGALVLISVLLAGFWYFRRLHPVRSHPRSHALLITAWGLFAVPGVALIANEAFGGILTQMAGLSFADRWGAAISAPIVEETLKLAGVALLALMVPQAIRGPLDGFAYGALAGFGFEIAENYLYVFNTIVAHGAVHSTVSVLDSLIGRVGTIWWGHWAMGAVAGAGLGYLVGVTGRPLARRLLVAVGAFVLTMAMHAWWDFPLLAGGTWVWARGPAILVIAVVVYRVARRRYLDRFRSAAAAEADRGVLTAAETEILTDRRRRRRERRRTPGGTPRRLLTDLRSAELDLIDTDLNDPGSSADLRTDVGDLRSRLEATRR